MTCFTNSSLTCHLQLFKYQRSHCGAPQKAETRHHHSRQKHVTCKPRKWIVKVGTESFTVSRNQQVRLH